MIPLLRPLVPSFASVAAYFVESERCGQLTNFGPLFDTLSNRLSAKLGRYALPVANGTAAIEIALRSLHLARGSRVLIPDFTHAGTLLAVKRADLEPVLCRVNPQTWQLDPDDMARLDIDAIIVVSPFGYSVDFARWEFFSKARALPIVYDLAGAFGMAVPTIVMNPVCYSMHATKNFGIGEGGIVVLPSSAQWGRARALSNFDTMLDRTIGSMNGWNSKLDELHCAYALALLEQPMWGRFLDRIAAKRSLLKLYASQLPGAYAPDPVEGAPAHAPSLCVLGNLPAKVLEQRSDKLGVTFRQYYVLLSRMPALISVRRASESDASMERCVALPGDVDIHGAMAVIDAVKSAL